MKSEYKGVRHDIKTNKWRSTVTENNRTHECGYYETDRQAAKARDLRIVTLGLSTPLQILKPI